MSRQKTDRISLPNRWITGILFERVLRDAGDLVNSTSETMYFRLPIGCKIMVDAGTKLLSLINQLQYIGKQIIVDFEEGEDGTLGYLNRMGFIDLLNPQVEILPYRPLSSATQFAKVKNPFLVEFKPVSPNPQQCDRSLPIRLTEALVNALDCQFNRELQDTTYTLFGELIDNIYEHSNTKLDGFAVLQVYQKSGRVKVCVSDSGEGLIETLRPTLKQHNSKFARLSDKDLVVEAFRSGISRYGKERGCGLKACADHAIRFRANLEVRLPTCFVRLIPSSDGYHHPHTAHVLDDPPPLLGTHIAFDFRLDSG